MVAAGRACQPGDQISYYVTGRTRNVSVNEYSKLAGEWNAAQPDENVEYYQTKVLEIWERFRRFTEQEGLLPYRDESAEESPQLSLF
jgi:hypothetical protein